MRPHTIIAPRSTARAGAILAVASALLVALAGGCEAGRGSGGDQDEQRYRFSRSQELLFRLDTAVGQVWAANHSGDGGWRPVGTRPDAAGLPEVPGRYLIQNLTRRQPARVGKPQIRLLRFDRGTGRSWLIELGGETEAWTAIAEPEGRETPTDGPGSVAQVAVGDEPAVSAEDTTGAEPESDGAPGRREIPVVVPRERFGKSLEERQKNVGHIMSAVARENVPIEMKIWGTRQLGVLEPEIAVPALLELLGHDDPEVVVAAVDSLHQIGQPNTIPKILALRAHPDPRVREAVAAAVAEVP